MNVPSTTESNGATPPPAEPVNIKNILVETIKALAKTALCIGLYRYNSTCFALGFLGGVVHYAFCKSEAVRTITEVWNIFLSQSKITYCCLGLGAIIQTPTTVGAFSFLAGWRLGTYLGEQYTKNQAKLQPPDQPAVRQT